MPERILRRNLAAYVPDERRGIAHAKLMRAIELLGTRVAPLVRKALSKKAMLPAA